MGSLNPKNCFEQQELFFANDCKVDPVFEYMNIEAATKTMHNFSVVNFDHLDLAKSLMDLVLKKFGSETAFNE